MGWDAFTDLMPTEQEVGQNLGWALRALLKTKPDKSELYVPGGPPASRELLVPYQYREDRTPAEPTITLPDGMFGEALEELKDGRDVAFRVDVHGASRCHCTGKRHRLRCPLAQSVSHAVTTLLREFQIRARVPLALAPAEQYDAPIMMDDHERLAPPTVRFRIVPDMPERDAILSGP